MKSPTLKSLALKYKTTNKQQTTINIPIDDYICQVCGEIKTDNATWLKFHDKDRLYGIREGNVCESCKATYEGIINA